MTRDLFLTGVYAPAVHVVNASKTFGSGAHSFLALQQLSFDVRSGERVALLGASGSGKSTLIRALCGLERLDEGSGSVHIAGELIQQGGRLAARPRHSRRAMGVVFQQFNLVPSLSVMTNVVLGLCSQMPTWRALTGRFNPEERQRALQALEQVGLAEKAHQRASTLSGGQQQRVAVARALVRGAKVILADEPVASLDPESARKVMDTLVSLTEMHGMTLITSLHQVDIARRYCQRALALKNGRLVAELSAAQLEQEQLNWLYETKTTATTPTTTPRFAMSF